MSLEVINRVWDRSQQHSSSLVVMQALAWYADKKGVCWPGNEELARRSKQKERNLQYILKQLELEGEIFRLRLAGKGMKSFTVVTVGYGNRYLYRVLRQSLMLDKSHARQLVTEWSKGATERQKVQSSDREKVQSDVQKVQSSVVKVQSSASKGAIQRRPYKEYEPSGTVKEPSGTGNPSGAAEPPGEALPVKNMWAGFKKRFKAKYTLPYRQRDGDAAQLATARRTYAGMLSDAVWDTACDNYFASPLGDHTMRDLCARLHVFGRSALNRFKTPVVDAEGGSHGNGKSDTNRRADSESAKTATRESGTATASSIRPDRRKFGKTPDES